MPRWTTLISIQNSIKKIQRTCASPSHTSDEALLSLVHSPPAVRSTLACRVRNSTDTFKENVSLISFPVHAEFV